MQTSEVASCFSFLQLLLSYLTLQGNSVFDLGFKGSPPKRGLFFMNATVRNMALVVLTYHFLKSTAGEMAKRIIVGQPTITFSGIGVQGIRAKLNLPVTNNTPAPLPIDSFKGALFYGPHKLAQIVMINGAVIRSGQKKVFSIDVRADFIEVGEEILNFVGSGNLIHPLYIKGQLVSANIVFPVNHKIRVL